MNFRGIEYSDRKIKLRKGIVFIILKPYAKLGFYSRIKACDENKPEEYI